MRRLPLTAIEPGRRKLPPRAAHYLSRVLRSRVGERIEVFDPAAGVTAIATVLATGGEVLIDIETPRGEKSEPPLILLQGYPKGEKLGDIVRDATELGATLIVPTICARSVARPDASRASAKQERFAAIAAEAARQCGRARAPEVATPQPLEDALALAELAAHRFALWERATTPLGPDLHHARREAGVALLIGPEGGLTDDEVKRAADAGFLARSLGPIVLRTETAATAALGAVRVLLG